MSGRVPYREVWSCDFEFSAPPGELPEVVCGVFKEWRTGRVIRRFVEDLRPEPPFDTGPDSLFVAFFASAEFGCFKALGWDFPERAIDLFAEFRVETNGEKLPAGRSLLGALTYFGLPAMGAEEKSAMRDLIIGGGSWDEDQRRAILDYCQEDVEAVERLFSVLEPVIAESSQRLGCALLRGRYMMAVAGMEWSGVPMDRPLLSRLQEHWETIQLDLIQDVDADFGVYDGATFKGDRFLTYLSQENLPWDFTETGRPVLDDDFFSEMARSYPRLKPLADLRRILGQLRLHDLAVGRDGRNRTLLSPFRSRTGRNQPSNSRFIFGAPAWLRGLIVPGPGKALAYCDWSAQEVAIAAGLSGDQNLIAAYMSGDPYLGFGKQSGLIPEYASKRSHGAERERLKVVVLGVGYGMQAASLARRADVSIREAQNLLVRHRETYRGFWDWAEGSVDQAMLGEPLVTRFGWRYRVQEGSQPNPRSLLNFPAQSSGADMMRLAACEATEAGLEICAPVHDAFLLQAPADEIDDHVERLKAAMRRASRLVIGRGDIECRVDAEIVAPGGRYRDPRGAGMWSRVMKLIGGEAVAA
jgi:hypothetical protein